MPPALASAGFEGNRLVEIIRTAAPAIIVMGGAIQSTEVLKNQRDYSLAYVTIQVTGHQWCREYEYLDDGVRYGSKLSTSSQQIAGPWCCRLIGRYVS